MITRRSFLASSLLLATRRPQASRIHDVAVLGAGMAGLTTARRLAAAGLDVIVLEARNRVGGRMHTLKDPTRHGLEVGAQMVHGSRADTWELLRELGTETRPMGAEGWGSMSWNEAEGFRARDWERIGKIDERVSKAFKEYRGEDMSYEAFVKQIGLTSEERDLMASGPLSWAGEPSEVSLRAVMEDGPPWDAYLDMNYQVVAGYSSVAEKMAARLGERVRLASVVRNIEWKRGEVKVDYARAGSAEVLRAQRAVVTLPIGILQSGSPTFAPNLPAWKRKSIDGLQMGRVVTVHFLFDDYFWREKGVQSWIARGDRITFYDPHPEGTGMPVLMGWIAGTAAQELSDLGKVGGTERALSWIAKAFPGVDVPKRVQWSNLRDWVSDPYSIGCYSFTRPGGTGQRAVLATPIEGTLYFAGEATAEPPHYQTVHGAYRSGKRAAREILAAEGMPV